MYLDTVTLFQVVTQESFLLFVTTGGTIRYSSKSRKTKENAGESCEDPGNQVLYNFFCILYYKTGHKVLQKIGQGRECSCLTCPGKYCNGLMIHGITLAINSEKILYYLPTIKDTFNAIFSISLNFQIPQDE